MHRLDFVLRKLRVEKWLPRELSDSIGRECGELRQLLKDTRMTTEEAGKRVRALALLCFKYDELLLRSSTLCQIRVLELEFAERLG